MPKIASRTEDRFTITIVQANGVIDIQFDKSILKPPVDEEDEKCTAVRYLSLLAVTTIQDFLENDPYTTRATKQ